MRSSGFSSPAGRRGDQVLGEPVDAGAAAVILGGATGDEIRPARGETLRAFTDLPADLVADPSEIAELQARHAEQLVDGVDAPFGRARRAPRPRSPARRCCWRDAGGGR